MNQKSDITKYIAEQFGLSTDEKSIRKLTAQWWQNPRKKEKGGLRLTDEGFARLTAHFTAHKVRFEDPVEYTNRLIIQLDNFIDCPWYITNKAVFVFNDKTLSSFPAHMKRLVPERNKIVNEIINIDYCGTTAIKSAI